MLARLCSGSHDFRTEVENRLAPFFEGELGGRLDLGEDALLASAPAAYRELLQDFLAEKRVQGGRWGSSVEEFSAWANERRLRFAGADTFFKELRSLVKEYSKDGMSGAAARMRKAAETAEPEASEFMTHTADLLDQFNASAVPEIKNATQFNFWVGQQFASLSSVDHIAASNPAMCSAFLNIQERTRAGHNRLADQSANSPQGGGTGHIEPSMGPQNPGTANLGPDMAAKAAGVNRAGEQVFPTARAVSLALSKVGEGNESPKSENLTQWVMQWGQFVDHDFALFPENLARPNIIQNDDGTSIFIFEAEKTTDAAGRTTVPNNITGFIDASNVYGSDAERTSYLREPPSISQGAPQVGRLRVSHGQNGEVLPPTLKQFEDAGLHIETDPGDVLARTAEGLRSRIEELEKIPGSECDPAIQEQLRKLRAELGSTEEAIGKTFVAGDLRVSEQPGLTTIHTMLIREHNRVAEKTAARFLEGGEDAWKPYFGGSLEKFDEFVFTYARNYVTGVVQNITFDEWLPSLIGESRRVGDYQFDPNADPRQQREFAAALFRIGHTLVPDELRRVGEDVETIALRDAFFRPADIIEKGVDGIARGLTAQGELFDPKVVDSLREFLFKAHQGDTTLDIRLDLIATNLLRGRELEIASYNELRAVHGLERYSRFDQISDDPQVVDALRSLYQRDGMSEAQAVDHIEAWIGAVSEKHAPGSDVGELIGASFQERFRQLQNGDRFNFNAAGEYPSITRAAMEARRNKNAGASAFKFFPGDKAEIGSSTLFKVLERNGVQDLPGNRDNIFRQPEA